MTHLRDTFEYVRITYRAKTSAALGPGFAFRERVMHGEVKRQLQRSHTKIALMSHNAHLAKDVGAIRSASPASGPGGGAEPSLGTFLNQRYSGEIFSIWMLIGRGRDSQPYSSKRTISELKGTLNAILGEIGDCFVLPIVRGDERARSLRSELPIAMDGNVTIGAAVARQTDAIFFVRDVTPLRL